MNRAPKPYKEYGRYGSVGIELVLSILLGWWVGHWADVKWFGGAGYVSALGFVLGTYAGFRALFATAAKMQKDIERAERAERGEDPWAPPGGPEAPSPTETSAPTSRPDEPDERAKPHDDA